MEKKKIAIIGGGASGFFAGIEAAKNNDEVHLFESQNYFLKKVKISGGGRCNVTHNQYDISQFCQNYPRGQRELRSPFEQFQAEDTVQWFSQHGVNLIVEPDGRMFPDTHQSQTIIDCFLNQAKKTGVQLHLNSGVRRIKRIGEGFELFFDNSSFNCDRILIATGSSSQGYKLVESLDHVLSEMAPSLFSFVLEEGWIKKLAGTSFQKAQLVLSIDGEKKQKQKGPLLLTHKGMSGPVILKLSAWAAREMKRAKYRAKLKVNWLGKEKHNEVIDLINELKVNHKNGLIKNSTPAGLTKNFWNHFLDFLSIESEKKWSEISKKDINKIIDALFQTDFEIKGQNTFKDEFVTCGGVRLKDVNLKTMESKIVPGLFFAGELLDIDGITGGFNFQNAWTTGFIAGKNIAND
jgi:predicted Rossmann fold flavoprotein